MKKESDKNLKITQKETVTIKSNPYKNYLLKRLENKELTDIQFDFLNRTFVPEFLIPEAFV